MVFRCLTVALCLTAGVLQCVGQQSSNGDGISGYNHHQQRTSDINPVHELTSKAPNNQGNRYNQQRHRNKLPPTPDATAKRNAAHEVSISTNAFTSALYKEIIKQQRGNVFFSPLSIHSILTMTSLGAQGKTLAEMERGLSLPTRQSVNLGYNFLMGRLSSVDSNTGVTMKISNKIYVASNYALSPKYRRDTKGTFYAEAENINFKSSDAARRTINTWVENNTNNRIKNVITDGMVSSDTAMVLVNAVFFKGTWKTQFDPKETKTKKFYVSPDREVDVPMMFAAGSFNFKYDEHLDARILNLFYKNDKFSMMLVLPNERNGLADLEKKITPDMLERLAPHPEASFNVNVTLPKFRLEEATPLNNILKSMGLEGIFSSSANLTGMLDGGQGLKVSDVAHKSFIEVNEEGAEAAATTVMSVQVLSVSYDDTQEFLADHPFLFIVRQTKLNHILFMGRYVGPSSDSRN